METLTTQEISIMSNIAAEAVAVRRLRLEQAERTLTSYKNATPVRYMTPEHIEIYIVKAQENVDRHRGEYEMILKLSAKLGCMARAEPPEITAYVKLAHEQI